jgi:hypothetical protein
MDFYANSANNFSLTLYELGGTTPHDISAMTFRMDFRVADDETPVVQLTIGDGLTINNGANGLLTGNLSGARVKTLLNGRNRRPVEVSLWRTDEAEDLLMAHGQQTLVSIGKRADNDSYT